jgi:sirohydrochlorin ferrochelatase
VKRAILLVDHGSRRPEANAQLEQLAALVGERVPDTIVRFAHMELATPDIATAIAQCAAAGARELVVHPYFLAPGNHSTHDIPRQVNEAAGRHPGLTVRVSEPLGLHPKLVDVILDRVDEVAREA